MPTLYLDQEPSLPFFLAKQEAWTWIADILGKTFSPRRLELDRQLKSFDFKKYLLE